MTKSGGKNKEPEGKRRRDIETAQVRTRAGIYACRTGDLKPGDRTGNGDLITTARCRCRVTSLARPTWGAFRELVTLALNSAPREAVERVTVAIALSTR